MSSPPVADLADGSAGVIGDRSYSSDPTIAADMVSAAVRGFRLSGVASVVKHWPGHGATVVDSHRALPTVDVDYELWTQRERVPFVAAIEEDVDMVMVGHLALPGLDPAQDGQRPASVSPVLIETLLREELGFQGVVVTDALDMGAVRSIERGELAVQAIEAGVDILLAPPDLVAARDALSAAVASGRISQERLDQSVSRILTLKDRLGLPIEMGPAEMSKTTGQWLYDQESAITATTSGMWSTSIAADWNIGTNPNGGYAMASSLRAMRQLVLEADGMSDVVRADSESDSDLDAVAKLDPLTVTTHFLRPSLGGEMGEIKADLVRPGRRLSTATASLTQGGKERLRVIAAFGHLDDYVDDADSAPVVSPSTVHPRLGDCSRANDSTSPATATRRMSGPPTVGARGGASHLVSAGCADRS